MKTIEEMIAVMTAFKEGKEIEYKDDGGNCWLPASAPSWNWFKKDYRVEPKYRPFSNAEECLKAMQAHGFLIKETQTEAYHLVVTIGHTMCWLGSEYNGLLFATLFAEYEFINGTPCGVLEE